MADLWIRSQKKDLLIKVDTITIEDGSRFVYADDTAPRFNGYVIFGNNGGLGEYETKQRALEVLDDIQDLLVGEFFTNWERPIIYEMPKE